jgi:hypothetical protein
MRGSRDSKPLLAVGGLFLVVALPILGVGLSLDHSQYLRRHGLLHSGLTATGIVLSKSRIAEDDWTGFGTTYRYRVTYRFQTPGAAPITDTAEVGAATWALLAERGPIRVRYLPEKPQQHAVWGQSSNWVGALLFTGFGGLLSALGATVFVLGIVRSLAGRRPAAGIDMRQR